MELEQYITTSKWHFSYALNVKETPQGNQGRYRYQKQSVCSDRYKPQFFSPVAKNLKKDKKYDIFVITVRLMVSKPQLSMATLKNQMFVGLTSVCNPVEW